MKERRLAARIHGHDLMQWAAIGVSTALIKILYLIKWLTNFRWPQPSRPRDESIREVIEVTMRYHSRIQFPSDFAEKTLNAVLKCWTTKGAIKALVREFRKCVLHAQP